MLRGSGGVRIEEDTAVGGQVHGGHDYASLFAAESGRLYRSLFAYTGSSLRDHPAPTGLPSF